MRTKIHVENNGADLEKKVIEILELQNKILFLGTSDYSLNSSSCLANELNFEYSNKGLLSDGILIPIDLDTRGSEFIISNNKSKTFASKWISIPDFIYVDVSKNYLDVFPVDIKSSSNFSDDDRMGQISAFNLSALLKISSPLRRVLKEIQNEFSDKKLKLNSGYYIVNNNSEKKFSLQNELFNLISEANIDFGVQGIHWSDFSIFNGRLIFKTNMDYFISKIRFDEFTYQLSEIKNSIMNSGFFPSEVIAYGFDADGQKVMQFEYDPIDKQVTYSPRRIQLKSRITDLQRKLKEISDEIKFVESIPPYKFLEEIISDEYKDAIKGLEKREVRLLSELNEAKLQLDKIQIQMEPVNRPSNEKKIDKKIKQYASLLKKIKSYEIVLKEIYSKKISISSYFYNYKKNMKWYSDESISKAEEQRNNILSKLRVEHISNLHTLQNIRKISFADSEEELKYVDKKYKQRISVDERNTKIIKNFISESLYQFANKFQIAPHPKILYINNDNKNVYKIHFRNILSVDDI